MAERNKARLDPEQLLQGDARVDCDSDDELATADFLTFWVGRALPACWSRSRCCWVSRQGLWWSRSGRGKSDGRDSRHCVGGCSRRVDCGRVGGGIIRLIMHACLTIQQSLMGCSIIMEGIDRAILQGAVLEGIVRTIIRATATHFWKPIGFGRVGETMGRGRGAQGNVRPIIQMRATFAWTREGCDRVAQGMAMTIGKARALVAVSPAGCDRVIDGNVVATIRARAIFLQRRMGYGRVPQGIVMTSIQVAAIIWRPLNSGSLASQGIPRSIIGAC